MFENTLDVSNLRTNDERRLVDYLMTNYDNNIRPVLNASQPVIIRLGITLTQIFDLDEKNQVLTTNVWLDQEWIDEFLAWNSSSFGGLTKIRIPCEKIWRPDIVLYNSADDYTRGYMNSRAIIEPSGNVFWPPPTKFRSTCQVDVTYFPFDDQKCKLKLGSWIYDGLQVDVLNRTAEVDMSNYIPNGEWDLLEANIERNVVYYSCCPEPFPDVTITLTIRRKILYYTYNVILPCMMLSVLTLLVFCIPPDSGEKIALGVTVLLAFSVFMLAISEKLPETSESIPLLGIYLTVVMSITSISVIMTVIVLNFHYRGPQRRRLPRWLKTISTLSNSTLKHYFPYMSITNKYAMGAGGGGGGGGIGGVATNNTFFNLSHNVQPDDQQSGDLLEQHLKYRQLCQQQQHLLQQQQQRDQPLYNNIGNSCLPTNPIPLIDTYGHRYAQSSESLTNIEDNYKLFLHMNRTKSCNRLANNNIQTINNNNSSSGTTPTATANTPIGAQQQRSGSNPKSHKCTSSCDNDCQQKQQHHCANYDKLMTAHEELIDTMCRYMLWKSELKAGDSAVIHEWRLLALFVDRILFWIFFIITFCSSVMFLIVIPIQQRGFPFYTYT
ncbi:neuronal acetylcholine receptor subunit alpha-10-like [Oppia nitens]|uniref:neuronal acetylcholine receptor subunit alpha-10-like n=1 Tax=Oppia nitens TaxID=1686743 RepID=UPI0023DC4500|nr:neuronal acetylcholine receptor subunit alpha-10-like [Oppia nitens]